MLLEHPTNVSRETQSRLWVVQDAQKIRQAQAWLRERLQDAATLIVDGVYVKRWGAGQWSVSWVEPEGFWFTFRELPERHYGIGLGLTCPEPGVMLHPVSESSLPLAGIDRSMNIALAIDLEG